MSFSERWRGLVQEWTKFFREHPRPHLVVGSTRSVVRWRDDTLLQLVLDQRPSGQFSFRRDLDQDRSQYLVLVAYETETDAERLARSVGAAPLEAHSGFASTRRFDLSPAVVKKQKYALKQRRPPRHASTGASA
jgi:hypothetical protein